MRRHLILHIGLTKTGSTTIQHVLAVRRPALQAQGVYFPKSPGWANHALLAAALVNDTAVLATFHPANWAGMSPAARIASFREEWAAEMAALPAWAERCLITAEQLGMLLHTDEEIGRLAEFLRPHFSSVMVVVYLRRQDAHAASYYNQALRGGLIGPPSLPAGGPAELAENDYGAKLDRYARHFGEAAIRPRIYDRALLVNGDIFDDFQFVTGLSVQAPDNDRRRHANAGLSLAGQALLRAAGARMAALWPDDQWRNTPQWRLYAESVSDRFAGIGWQPTQAMARDFVGRFAAGNEQVRSRFFPAQESLFSADFSTLPQQPMEVAREDVMAAALDLAMHEIVASTRRMAQASITEYRLLRRLGDGPAMRQALLQAIKYAPDLLMPRVHLAGLLIAEGKLADAQEHAGVAQTLSPQDPVVLRLSNRLARAISSQHQQPPVVRA